MLQNSSALLVLDYQEVVFRYLNFGSIDCALSRLAAIPI